METTENKNEGNKCCRGHKHHAGWILLGIVGFTAFAFLFGGVIMWLWNGLMPAIFHLGEITYWQALGLALLARLLFGSFHHRGPHHRGPHRFGMWRNRRNAMHEGMNCRESFNGGKWNYYEKFWNEEGEKAFNEYVNKKNQAE